MSFKCISSYCYASNINPTNILIVICFFPVPFRCHVLSHHTLPQRAFATAELNVQAAAPGGYMCKCLW